MLRGNIEMGLTINWAGPMSVFKKINTKVVFINFAI